MFKIQTLNKIAMIGLEGFPRDNYEIASEILNPDAILVRSADMHSMTLPASVKAIGRAGAGVNNIPVEQCSKRGIVVFNTPGANANGVKELVLAGLLLSSRRIVPGIEWVRTLKGKGKEVGALVEKGKNDFVGPEIKGKKLGVIGLGAIGVMVANDALALGMEVAGYDPYISVEAAWGLARTVRRATSLDMLLAESDYITLHVPLMDQTKGMLNRDKFALMKKGVRIVNLARGGLVKNADLLEALKAGAVGCYVTDFPDDDLLDVPNVIAIPHLGASTPEAEDNCAVMAVEQVRDFLENGNVKNAVNFPACALPVMGRNRIVVANANVPNMVGQITTVLAADKINIADMMNKSAGDRAYNIIDIDGDVAEAQVEKLRKIEGVITARLISKA
ncbi:MAG TPA: phosphoglycerate dehydrogenase [Polyangia bacterium]|jgi:Phosphoglycerate dehydrogenase and related dehydrogenases|nr:phosphoglycerate dehydrogenase [Polyangia bacterium]